MLIGHFPNSRLERLPLAAGQIHIQRDDLLHPVVSGNKWRKMAGWLRLADEENKSTLLTYGGAYSNHLVATACLAHATGRQSVGILRGGEPMENPYLSAAKNYGMKLCQVSRAIYRDKSLAFAEIQARSDLRSMDWQGALVIPEGGTGPEGFEGFHGLVASWQDQAFHPHAVLHASATATTATGLALALAHASLDTQVFAVPVLHNLPQQQAFAAAHGVTSRIQWITGHEFGGYARANHALRTFCQTFTSQHHIPCEPIYTGKALYALSHLLETLQLSPEGLVFLHTGGVLNFRNRPPEA